MKKPIIAVFTLLSIAFFPGCGTSQKENTHTHSDGTTHENHDTTKAEQQEFKVTDTTAAKDSNVHMHKNGEAHSH